MFSTLRCRIVIIGLALSATAGSFTLIANASHSWGGYHWARTSNPFTLQLGNNTSGTWTSFLNTVSSDWSASEVLDTTVVSGGTNATKGKKTPKNCVPTLGRVEVCNANYGGTDWLGVAQVWIYSDGHIAQGTVKNNDYYFGNSTYQYNNEAEKRHVICQELGHTLGLDHQSTDGSSLDTCMDYYHNTSNTDMLSTHPNQHDYDELGTIYAHLDSTTTLKATTSGGNSVGINLDDPSAWGKEIRKDSHGHSSLFERDLGDGNKVFTFVIWTK